MGGHVGAWAAVSHHPFILTVRRRRSRDRCCLPADRSLLIFDALAMASVSAPPEPDREEPSFPADNKDAAEAQSRGDVQGGTPPPARAAEEEEEEATPTPPESSSLSSEQGTVTLATTEEESLSVLLSHRTPGEGEAGEGAEPAREAPGRSEAPLPDLGVGSAVPAGPEPDPDPDLDDSSSGVTAGGWDEQQEFSDSASFSIPSLELSDGPSAAAAGSMDVEDSPSRPCSGPGPDTGAGSARVPAVEEEGVCGADGEAPPAGQETHNRHVGSEVFMGDQRPSPL